MKRLFFIALICLITTATYAQIPPPPDPSCAYCGVNLRKGETHKSTCPYYEAPKEESSSHSTHLRDYTPIPDMSSIEHALIYEVGIDGKKPCSHCRSLYHQPWCEVIKPQEWARQYKAKAESATTEAGRKQALRDYNRMVDNLKIFIDLNYTLEKSEPLPEVKSRLNVSREKYEMLYKVGVRGFNMTCPQCDNMVHEGWCAFAMLQRMANEAKAKAIAATTLEERKNAIIGFHVCEDNLLASYEQSLREYNYKKKQEAERKEQEQAQQNTSPAPVGFQHLSSVDLKNGYDKKLGNDSWATAYGKTFPNGQEQWALYDQDGQEVGQLSKGEPASVPSGLDVLLGRDHSGKWGV